MIPPAVAYYLAPRRWSIAPSFMASPEGRLLFLWHLAWRWTARRRYGV